MCSAHIPRHIYYEKFVDKSDEINMKRRKSIVNLSSATTSVLIVNASEAKPRFCERCL